MLVSATAKMNVFGFLVSTLCPFQRGFDWKNRGWQMAEGFGRARHFVHAGPCDSLHRACGGQRTARPTVPAPQARHIYRTTTRTKFQPRRGGIFGGRASSRAARQERRPTKFEMSLLSGAMEDRAALLQRFRAYGAGRGEAMSQFGERLRCGKILSRENSCAASLRIIGYLPFRLHP